MDVSHLLDGLNEAQREAVAVAPGSTLVLAGAGSGKTRVLVHRIAWLIQAEGASPYGILAVTFTNKAAGEMRARIEELLGIPLGGMWVGTFHGLAHRLLRTHWQDAGLPQNFQILDSDDQYRLVRRILKAMELDEARWPPRQVQWFINGRKDEGLRPKDLGEGDDPYQRQMVRAYAQYEESCRKGGLVDFAELLLRAFELWRDRPEVLAHYRQRFSHVLVDEFQDTNGIQYDWLRLLAGSEDKLFAVGDDDQSIYGWRGARVENLERLRKDYPTTRLLRLEQNYRSTGNILKAANALIARNAERLGKNLWTSGGDGEPISMYNAYNEVDEARFVVERIRQWVEHGSRRDESAILYRSNAQSRLFEDALIQAGMPYRVYGGQRFFERAEIKDALAYLRLIANSDDDASFERAINMPPRGIGLRTVDTIRAQARAAGQTLWQASRDLVRDGGLNARAAGAVSRFIELIAAMTADTAGLPLAERVDHAIRLSGLPEHFKQKEKGEKGQSRVENLEELVNATRQFVYENEDDLDELSAFLSHAALESGEAQADSHDDCVQLMTLHSAKGLEFPLVFIAGVEEGLFPHQMSIKEPGRLEEERRLCYVGMTRAMQKLYLSHAESRRLHGSETYPLPSRFLREIPAELLEEVRARPQISRPVYQPRMAVEDEGEFRLGQRVAHPKFGEGVVVNQEGQGGNARVQINFEVVGAKWLVLAYANLQAIA